MKSYVQLCFKYIDDLKKEISSYNKEEDIWKLGGEIKNPPGNLCLHICGNLNNYMGAAIGNTGYIRHRDLEFSKKNVSRSDLLKQIDETKEMLRNIFDGLTLNDINKIYPKNDFGDYVTYGYVFSILISHLAYHLGQINYHRRILD